MKEIRFTINAFFKFFGLMGEVVRSCKLLRANFGPAYIRDISMEIHKDIALLINQADGEGFVSFQQIVFSLIVATFHNLTTKTSDRQPKVARKNSALKSRNEILLTKQNSTVDVDQCLSPSYPSKIFKPARLSESLQAFISHASHIWSAFGLLAAISFWTSSSLSSCTTFHREGREGVTPAIT